MSMIHKNNANAPLKVIVIGDDDAAIRLRVVLASASLVQQVIFRTTEAKVWEDVWQGTFNTIFIDPFTFNLDDATRFIFRVRQEHPNIVFVLHLDLKTLRSDDKGFYQGERIRFSHYFTLDKGLSLDNLQSTIDDLLGQCREYLLPYTL